MGGEGTWGGRRNGVWEGQVKRKGRGGGSEKSRAYKEGEGRGKKGMVWREGAIEMGEG